MSETKPQDSSAERTSELECYDDGEGYPPNVKCTACGEWMDAIIEDVYSCFRFRFCPTCGARRKDYIEH